ncbi:fructose-bisphosphate aldolase, class II [Paenibacillus sp. yr247]|uniref:class II fructose-1,6-bisphosphate aldolase n=1 Tax=Paenibacillus sp. yr247 TaxID=1761880 RepID=UPI00088E2156|nr:class II fructose-1,6-bisphosphate aldolase [Paenibacillus sp. yr247]SDP09801.1 fructose-bisphosphate aldolase, class II [Paenibacillus sp. yr247]
MKLVSMKEMLAKALDGKYAVGQFNVNNLEFTQAILLAAQEENAPVILGISEPYIPYLGGYKLVTAIVQALVEEWKIEIPVAVHLDHGLSFESCIKAMAAGFTSVMIDGSHHSLEENIAVTKRVVEAARAFNVSVEAELGRIAGREDDLVVQEADAMHAVPADCVALARATSIDCIAPALGSVHGPYKGEPKLNFVRMEEIRKQTGIPLVLHGGTGIPSKDIQQAITLGTAKINVNTENQMACTSAVRQILSELPNEYDPRKYLGPAREAVKETVKRKMREFGSSGKALV